MTQIYKPEGSYDALKESAKIFESIKSIEDAIASGIILEAPVLLCDNERNLTLQLGKFKGIMPKQEVLYSPCMEEPKDIAIITQFLTSVKQICQIRQPRESCTRLSQSFYIL